MTCTLWNGLEEYCSIIISYLHCRSSVIFPSWKKLVRKLDVNVVPILYSCIAVFSEMKRYMNKIERLYILMKRFLTADYFLSLHGNHFFSRNFIIFGFVWTFWQTLYAAVFDVCGEFFVNKMRFFLKPYLINNLYTYMY